MIFVCLVMSFIDAVHWALSCIVHITNWLMSWLCWFETQCRIIVVELNDFSIF